MAIGGKTQPHIIGASVGGMHETVCIPDRDLTAELAGPSYVIEPERRGSPILAGEGARRSRVNLGLPWPPESRIKARLGSRRIPVPILWRGLTQRRDGRSEWGSGSLRIPFAELLARHIIDVVGNNSIDNRIVLAIPDALSDFSRQRLIDAMRRIGLPNASLLWTPVALALTWLETMGDQLKIHSDTDSLLIFHLGPGAIDSTTFRLREDVVNGIRYVVPVREKSELKTTYDSFDLASARVAWTCDKRQTPLDVQAHWYAIGLPGSWSTVPTGKLATWYRQECWEVVREDEFAGMLEADIPLEPPRDIEDILRVSGAPDRDRPKITKKMISIGLGEYYDLSTKEVIKPEVSWKTWGDLVRNLLESEVKQARGEIRGAIVAGFPFGPGGVIWTRIAEETLTGIKNPVASEIPMADGIWNAAEGGQAIARGAAIFGDRLERGLPTYYDTLPEFEVYAITPEGGRWEPLVKEREVRGDEIHRDIIEGEFVLPKNQKQLEVYLRLHDAGEAPIKLTQFHFPRGPNRRMPLALHVEVRPAGGLATVEIVPEDREFLGGMQVYLDYDEMQEVECVPEIELGCPPIERPHEIDPNDELLFGMKKTIESYLGCDFESNEYARLSRLVQHQLVQQITFREVPGKKKKVLHRIVDIDGKAATELGRELVRFLAVRIGDDFIRSSRPVFGQYDMTRRRDYLITMGAWLFGSVPEPIRRYVRSQLENPKTGQTRRLIDAAGRIFQTREEMTTFFQTMVEVASHRSSFNNKRRFTINWLRAAKRLLSGRTEAAQALNRNSATQIYQYLFTDIRSWIEAKGVDGFGATLQLLFYLFRYRMVERNFLASDSDNDQKLRQDLVNTVEEALHLLRRRSFLRGKRRDTSLEVLRGLKDFLDFRGSLNIIEKLSEFDEEATKTND